MGNPIFLMALEDGGQPAVWQWEPINDGAMEASQTKDHHLQL